MVLLPSPMFRAFNCPRTLKPWFCVPLMVFGTYVFAPFFWVLFSDSLFLNMQVMTSMEALRIVLSSSNLETVFSCFSDA